MDLAQPTPWVDVIGVDVVKGWIDSYRLSNGRRERVAATRPELARFARRASSGLVVPEASGGYERPLLNALAGAGVAFRLEPFVGTLSRGFPGALVCDSSY